MPAAYAVRDGGDAKSKKQSMADLKLRRLQELNSRLKEDLERPRVKVAEASMRYGTLVSPLRLGANVSVQSDQLLQPNTRLHGPLCVGLSRPQRRPLQSSVWLWLGWLLLSHVMMQTSISIFQLSAQQEFMSFTDGMQKQRYPPRSYSSVR